MSDTFGQMIRGLRMAHGSDDPPLKFETDGSAAVTFIGYTPSEIADILAAYREHTNLMMDMAIRAQSAQNSSDAVRYMPDSGGLDDARSR